MQQIIADFVGDVLFGEVIDAKGESEKRQGEYSLPNVDKTKYADYDKPITAKDIEVLRSIGRKSVNEFTSEDLVKAQKWAYKFYQQLGEKSPFFRAWFGDWRAYDIKNKIPVINKSTAKTFKAGKAENVDTGRYISWGDQIKGETKIKYGTESEVYGFLENIEKIVKNSILLDTNVSVLSSKHKMDNTEFMHSMYSIIEDKDGNECLIKLLVEEAFNDKMIADFSRAYELQEIKKVATLHTGVHSNNGGLTRQVTTNYSISELFDFVKQYDKSFTPKPVDQHMVNENGTPKKFYHGTREKFTEFSKKKAKPGFYGRGFYFTTEKSQSNVYGESMEVYLNIKNPLVPGETKITENQIINFLEAVAENEDYSIENYGTYDVNEIANRITNRDAFDVIQDINATAIGDFGEAMQLFNEVNNTNFDGVITPTETVVYDNTQIKSAEKGTPNANIGTFDKTEGDIRYSLPDLDADYLKAVENGDMETAQRMVDEAARESGHRIKGHHGTDIRFTIFDREKSNSSNDFGKGFYFSSSEFEAEQYQKDDAFGDTYNKIDGIAYDNALEKIRDMGEDANDDALFTRIYNEEFDKELKRRTDEGTVINAYLKMENPFIVSTGNWITEEEAINIAKNTMYADDVPDDIAISDWVHSIKAYAKQHDGKVDTNHFANNMGHAINLTNALLHQGKYDGVLDYTVGEKFGTTSDYHAIALYPNQIKSADPVTYDDDGNVIPLSQRFNPENKDIRYSLPDLDSNGQKLSSGQMEYFKDSKVKDGKGRLIPVYHGSKSAGFTEFTKSDEIGYFFARTIKTSRTYAGGSKAIYAPDKNSPEFSGAANYKVYLDIKKPYIIDGNGANWNQLEANGERVDISIKSQKWNNGSGIAKIQFKYNSKTYSQTVRTSEEFESFISKHTNPEMAKAFAYAMDQAVDKNGKGEFNAGFIWDFKNSVQGDTKNTRDIVRKAYNSHWNYDGVIFKNVVDSGDGSKIKADDLYVVFDSNQIKSVNNTNPTEDKDIRYSLPDIPDIARGKSNEELDKLVSEGKITTKQALDAAREEHGTMPKGENPKVDVDVPNKVSDTKGVRRFARTALESGHLTEGMSEDAKREIINGALNYEISSNKMVTNIAEKKVAKDINKAIQEWEGLMASGKIPTAEDIALGEVLLVEAAKTKPIL